MGYKRKSSLRKVLICLMLYFALLVPTLYSRAYYDYSADGLSLEEASKDPKYWNQGYVPDTENIHLDSDGGSIGTSGCSYFGASYCLVKMGVMNPETDNPVELVKWCKEDTANRMISGWHLQPNALPERYPGIEVIYPENSCRGLVGQELETWCLGKMNEGYFIALCMGHNTDNSGGAHWIGVDGFDEEGNMIIADSAYTAWNEPKKFMDEGNYGTHGSYGTRFTCYAMLFKKQGVDPLTAPSIYGGNFNMSPMTDEQAEEYNRILDEQNLAGMPEESPLMDNQVEIDLPSSNVLSIQEGNNVAQIKENIDSNKRTIFSWFTVLCKFLGIVCMVYAIILIICMYMDLSNNWVDISILKIATLGKVEVSEGTDKKMLPKGVLTKKQVMFRSALVFVIGVFLECNLIIRAYGWIVSRSFF